jgi:malonyl CoA-acyl carrier protein transacylase
MIAYLFPGQGSQRPGMGGGLFERFPRLTAMANEILGYSIESLCLNDDSGRLDQTEFTQPAIYVVSCLDYLRRVVETGRRPDYVAGHSAGEYAALFAAGAYDFETGLQLVQKRGFLTSKASAGGMAAVIGLSQEAAANVLAVPELSGLEIANDNSPAQVVIAGPVAAIDVAERWFLRAGAQMFVPLRVSGPFHSRHMQSASTAFEKLLAQAHFQEPVIPAIANVDAQPHQKSEIADKLGLQITNRVRWTQSVRYMLEQGVTEFHEIGGGRTLIKLVDQTREYAGASLRPREDVERAA